MTRRKGVPPISPTDLRDGADTERIERIWNRIEADLAPVPQQPARAGAAWVTLAAAVVGAFAVGLYAGKTAWQSPADLEVAEVDMQPEGKVEIDVFAAGSEGKTFELPGGGQLQLKPHTMVEVEHTGETIMTLKLLRGEADVDTQTSYRSAGLSIVAGATRLDTQAGSVFRVRRNETDVDVQVSGGSVDITSPEGKRRLTSGQQASSIPIRSTTASADKKEPKRIPGQLASLDDEDQELEDEMLEDEPTDEAPAEPDGYALLEKSDYKAAAKYFVGQPGGLGGAIASASSAKVLDQLSALAQVERKPELAERAWKRILSEFPDTNYALIAAQKLGGDYAKEYEPELEQVMGEEDNWCNKLEAALKQGPINDATHDRAQRYMAQYGDGNCIDAAQAVIDRFAAQQKEAAEGATEPTEPAEAEPAPDGSEPENVEDGTYDETL